MASERYDNAAIEKKWQEKWEKDSAFAVPDKAEGKENFYFLTEFPYPSGNLHVGHWYAFAVPDIFARYMRTRGYNVLYPVGFDAFGLPAENAAIKNKINPRQWTFDNIEYMRGQLRSMGASFDWSREVITADPGYYKWTQWLFIQFFNKGLAYRKETAVNWCPNDKTVLANEQVVDGHCERCGAEIEQRLMPQWNLKITDYADRLIDDLKDLDWPKQIKDAQTNWIGRSEGAEIDFRIQIYAQDTPSNVIMNAGAVPIKIFTTRPDTIFGATYLVLAPEHSEILKIHPWISNWGEVLQYIETAKKKTELERQENKEKTGVELKGVIAINPANGKQIPVWVADFVIGSYGTGAVFADAHDERDFEFAKKFNIPLKETLAPEFTDSTNPPQPGKEHTDRDIILAVVYNPKTKKYLCLKWKEQPWTTFVTGGIDAGEDPVEAAKREIAEETGYTKVSLVKALGHTYCNFYAAHKNVNRRVHNRSFLFQLDDEKQAEVSSDEKNAYDVVWLSAEEVVAAKLQHSEFGFLWQRIKADTCFSGRGVLYDSGEFSGLTSDEAIPKIAQKFGRLTKQYHLRDWVVSRQRYWGVPIPVVNCHKCGYAPVPEKDLPLLLPEVEDYLPTGTGQSPLAKVKSFVEATCPKCGGPAERETDTLDTFVDSSWYFLRYTDPKNENVFADSAKLKDWMPVNLYSGGSEHTTMHVLYSRFWHKAMYDLGLVGEQEPYLRRMNRGLIMGPDGQKMSKSRGNVIDPDEAVKELGTDTVRMYLAFIGPYNEVGAYPWTPSAAVGVRRFLGRVWRLEPKDIEASGPLTALLNQTIKKVGEDIANLKMNTAVSALMILLNELEQSPAQEAYKTFIQLLAPFAPHICAELAERRSFSLSSWPSYDETMLASAKAQVAVQINGKSRGVIELAHDAPEDEALVAAKEAAGKWLDGKPKKVVYVPGRVINIVI